MSKLAEIYCYLYSQYGWTVDLHRHGGHVRYEQTGLLVLHSLSLYTHHYCQSHNVNLLSTLNLHNLVSVHSHLRYVMPALCCNFTPGGDFTDEYFRRYLLQLRHPVSNEMISRRPREPSGYSRDTGVQAIINSRFTYLIPLATRLFLSSIPKD